VRELIAIGAHHIDIGQGPDEPHVVLCDPEGNEFCIIEPTNSFLTVASPGSGELRWIKGDWILLECHSRMAAGLGSKRRNSHPPPDGQAP